MDEDEKEDDEDDGNEVKPSSDELRSVELELNPSVVFEPTVKLSSILPVLEPLMVEP